MSLVKGMSTSTQNSRTNESLKPTDQRRWFGDIMRHDGKVLDLEVKGKRPGGRLRTPSPKSMLKEVGTSMKDAQVCT